MWRIVVLGRGGAGKSTLAARLGDVLDIPVVELDSLFWATDLTPTSPQRWTEIQRELVEPPSWILDGDLGPYDVLPVRLSGADTVIVLDFPLWRCAWRALRRSRENLDFWRWVAGYRRRGLPVVMAAVAAHAADADLHVLRTPRAVESLVASAMRR